MALKPYKVTVSGSCTGEVFIDAEDANGAIALASTMDLNALRHDVEIVAAHISAVDSVVEQILGTDYVN